MSCLLMTFAVEHAEVDPLGAKEAVAMAVEHLGGVRALSVEVQEDEQLRLNEVAPAHAAASPSGHRDGGGQTQNGRDGRSGPNPPKRVTACANCANYQQDPGWDDAGQGFYGRCAKSGRPVYKLFDLCGGWADK